MVVLFNFRNFSNSLKFNLHKRLVSLLFLLFFSSFTFSQENNDSIINYLQNITLEELINVEVVSASKTPQSQSEAPSIISVVTENDIEKMGVTSLIDILKHIPGIETSMSINGDYRVSIRGERHDGNILVLMDGVPVNDFYDGKAIFDYPVDFIEKIEVIRGPGSALFGSNALAGVISIFTKKQSKSVSSTAGSNASFSGNVSYFYKNTDSQFSISRGYLSSDGANVQPRTPDPNVIIPMNKNTNRWLKDEYFKADYTYKNLGISVFCLNRKQGEWVGPLYEVTQNSNLKNQQYIAEISYRVQITPLLTLIPRLYSTIINHDYHLQEHPDGWTPPNGLVFVEGAITREKYLSSNLGSELQLKYDVRENLNLIAGLVGEGMTLYGYDVTKNYNIVGPVYMDELGHYNNIEFNQREKSRFIQASYLQGIYNYKILGITAGVRYDNYSDFGSSINPRLGIVLRFNDLAKSSWSPVENIVIKALYGQAFRAPTFKELYDKTNIVEGISGVRGNDDLMAGTVKSTELGIEFKQKYYILRINSFYNISKNIISVFDPNGTGQSGEYKNMGDNVSRGWEGELILRPLKNFNIFANASYFNTLFSWNKDPLYDKHRTYMNNNPKGSPIMKNIPTFRLNGGFDFSIYKFQFFASINYGNESTSNNRYYIEARNVKIDPYLLGNFNLIFNATPKLTFMIQANDLDHIFDIEGKTKYSDPEESTNIDLLGRKGMRQPSNTVLLKAIYNL